jgi:hypothetical protein
MYFLGIEKQGKHGKTTGNETYHFHCNMYAEIKESAESEQGDLKAPFQS